MRKQGQLDWAFNDKVAMTKKKPPEGLYLALWISLSWKLIYGKPTLILVC